MREPPTRVTATGRVVAVGDLHGDMDKALAALRLARVLATDDDGSPRWVGGDTVVVQLGDVLDRGNTEIGIIKLLMELDSQAQKEGGGVYMLNGNHESLNVCGDFRYVTPGAFIESAVEFGIPRDEALRSWDGCIQARAALYLPGGRVAKMLSRNATVLIVNDTAFAHGGLLPTHVQYGIERINAEVAAWMRRDAAEDGFASPPFLAMGDGKSVMWNRQLSVEKWPNPADRYHAKNMLTQALTRVEAKRLVVGHTPQMRGANVECDGLVWRIDVGMSSGVLDAPVSILEITREADGMTDCRVVTEGEGVDSFDEPEALVDF
ncbi:MAG: Metallo-dependent phosphatase-like protein [Monoraphidium minutum]|nr:MAG: Metallo-dependent phosphatase-like protein [Monoraphidium minutum]